jgi:hypothetical protein
MRMLWHQREKISIRMWFDEEVRPNLHPIWAADLVQINKLMPSSWDFDKNWIIANCCVLPFLSPFLTREVRNKHLAWAENRTQTHSASETWLKHVPLPKELRVCGSCVRENRAEFGEPHLHRKHHLPGIDVCLEHLEKLIPIGNLNTHMAKLRRAIDTAANSPCIPVTEHEFLPFLNDATKTLLSRGIIDEALD